MAQPATPAENVVRRPVRLYHWTPRHHDTAEPAGDAEYERITQTSDTFESDFAIRSVVASWEATTPPDTWIEIAVCGGPRTPDSDWIVLARWAETPDAIEPTSVPGQDTDDYTVAADEIVLAAGREWRCAQARVSLLRPLGSDTPFPEVRTVTVLTSGDGGDVRAAESEPTGVAHTIDVPPHSQLCYRDADADLNGGGQSWCSPTSTAMVLEYWGVELPRPAVPYAARHTYDRAYGGTGNWPFNTAFAARFGLRAYVTRLRTLAEAEAYTRAGVPLIISMSFTSDQLDGAGYDTQGHLLVLVGFDETGDPIVNDPASHGEPDDSAVRTTYRREQLLTAWQHRGSGIAYVIHPPDWPLPESD